MELSLIHILNAGMLFQQVGQHYMNYAHVVYQQSVFLLQRINNNLHVRWENARLCIIDVYKRQRLADAVDDFKEFVKLYRIPVTYSRLGHDLLDTDDELSIGMVGMLGASRAGNFAIQNSDLVLCVCLLYTSRCV